MDAARDAVLFAGGTGVTAFTAFLQSLSPSMQRESCSSTALGPPTCSSTVSSSRPVPAWRPSLRCSLVCEETEGRLDVGVAWPAIEALQNPLFYLSGPPPMLAALGQQLQARGASAESIRIDAWD